MSILLLCSVHSRLVGIALCHLHAGFASLRVWFIHRGGVREFRRVLYSPFNAQVWDWHPLLLLKIHDLTHYQVSWKKVKSLSRVQLFVTLWTVAYQALLSMGFSRQEYWSGLLFPSPGDLSNPGIEPRSPALQADTLPPEPPGKSLRLPSFLICKL